MSVAVWIVGAVLGVLARGVLAEQVMEARDRAAFPPPGRLADIGGRRMHVLCQGATPGPTVVIEQGAGSPSVLWWPLQDRIAAFARVCTYDRAGYQWSDSAPAGRSLQDRAADLHSLLREAGVPGPYLLVAHSFGGPIVRLFARDYPDEVAGMVLVDTPDEKVMFGPGYREYVSKLQWVALAGETAAQCGIVRLALHWLRQVPDGFSPQAFRTLKAMVARPAFFRALRDDLRSLALVPPEQRHPGYFGASLGDLPVVVLAHGQAFPGPAAVLEDGWRDGQARLAALSSRGEMVVAANSNHMIQSDEPDLVIAAIQRVLAECKHIPGKAGAPAAGPAPSRAAAPSAANAARQ
jgi:pimeloyl-ACP methyl ester carboxylesterase